MAGPLKRHISVPKSWTSPYDNTLCDGLEEMIKMKRFLRKKTIKEEIWTIPSCISMGCWRIRAFWLDSVELSSGATLTSSEHSVNLDRTTGWIGQIGCSLIILRQSEWVLKAAYRDWLIKWKCHAFWPITNYVKRSIDTHILNYETINVKL